MLYVYLYTYISSFYPLAEIRSSYEHIYYLDVGSQIPSFTKGKQRPLEEMARSRAGAEKVCCIPRPSFWTI